MRGAETAMRRVTIKDIAQIAGVSYATVSRALSDSPEISEQTRSRILDICRKEGYRANVLARSLIRSKTNVLGLIIPDVTNPFYSELSLGIETYARSLGYNVMLCNSLRNDDTTAQLFDFLIGHQVDGIILANSYSEAKNWVHKYSSTIPIVLLSDAIDDSEGGGINAVSVDNLEGGRLAAEYLYALGHRKILYFGFRPSSVTHQMRFRGFCKALDPFGIVPEIIENPADSSSIANGYALGKTLFQRGFDGTAIFAAADSLALGVLQAADEFGVAVPEDISLFGFDNIIYSSLPKIMLSTIDQRKQLLAEAAVNILMEILNHPERDEFTHRLIRPTLVIRRSCRALE